jgi:nucleoside-diphosphate-sugar epimerase
MKVLLTGASGFIGGWVSTSLTRSGHEVIALMRSPEKLTDLRAAVDARGGDSQRISVVRGDLGRPALGLDGVPDFDVAVHLGASFAWGMDAASARRTNVTGGLELVDLCAQVGARLVAIGGYMLVSPTNLAELNMDLNRPDDVDWARVYRECGAYEASKAEQYARMKHVARERGVPFAGVHLASVSGHTQTGHLESSQPIAEFITTVVRGQLPAVPGGTSHWLPLVPVDHASELIATLATEGWIADRELLALDPDTPDLLGLVRAIAEAAGVRAPRRRVPLGLVRTIAATPLLRRLLGTSPEALSFIISDRFNVASTQAFAASHGLAPSDVSESIAASVAHLHGTPGRTP